MKRKGFPEGYAGCGLSGGSRKADEDCVVWGETTTTQGDRVVIREEPTSARYEREGTMCLVGRVYREGGPSSTVTLAYTYEPKVGRFVTFSGPLCFDIEGAKKLIAALQAFAGANETRS